jgi:hypothetical protein
VFVSSDGKTLPLLMAASAWSRALKPLVEVGDISDVDAIKYLKAVGVKEEDAEDAVKRITGGRFLLLIEKGGSRRDRSNEEWLQDLERDVRTRLGRRELNPTHAAFALLARSELLEYAALITAGLRADYVEFLLQKNILWMLSSGEYVFQSRYVQRYFQQLLEKD